MTSSNSISFLGIEFAYTSIGKSEESRSYRGKDKYKNQDLHLEGLKPTDVLGQGEVSYLYDLLITFTLGTEDG